MLFALPILMKIGTSLINVLPSPTERIAAIHYLQTQQLFFYNARNHRWNSYLKMETVGEYL